MLGWFKNRKRRRLLQAGWPSEWSEYLRANFRQYRMLEHLADAGQIEPKLLAKLHDATKVIVGEKTWVGTQGFVITPEVQVTIAAQAAMMLLGVNDYYFDNVSTIVVSPERLQKQIQEGYVVHENQNLSGVAYRGGYVLFSWHDVIGGARSSNDAHNLVVHEFAHCLDNIDGTMDGDLIFGDQETSQRWSSLVEREFAGLRQALETGKYTLLDEYGGTNKAEFFAVAAETFFERPERLKKTHAELYALLVKYFHLDPIDWQVAD